MSEVEIEHRMTFHDLDDGRQGWECSCGSSGSVGEWGDVEIAAERHTGDEPVVYVREPQ